MGRHSEYTPEIGNKICELVATSVVGTNQLCERDDMPSEETVYKWRRNHPDFAEKYAVAKQFQAEIMAEKLMDLCNVETFVDDKGVHRADPGLVAIQRLKVDTVKWQASKLAPKVYGERKTTEHDISEGTLMQKVIDKL